MSATILHTDAVSLDGFAHGDVDCLRRRCETMLEWFRTSRYASEPWLDGEPASVIDILGAVGFSDLRAAHEHALTLTRLAAHAAARASREGRSVTSFPDFLQELLDTYDVLAEQRLGGDAADALGEDAALSAQEGAAVGRVEPRDLGGHHLGEGAPLAQHVDQFVVVDREAAPGVSHDLPPWMCPSCGACIGLIGRVLLMLRISPHQCRRPSDLREAV